MYKMMHFSIRYCFRTYIQSYVFVYKSMNVKYAICRTDPRKVSPLTRITVFHICWRYEKIRRARDHHVLMNTSHRSTQLVWDMTIQVMIRSTHVFRRVCSQALNSPVGV